MKRGITEDDRRFMEIAIGLSEDNIDNGGGPFGAVIVRGGEIMAIRSALYWAGVKRICYANTKDDAKAIDFDDSFIYDQLTLPNEFRAIECRQLMRSDALRAFRKWAEKEDKVKY